MTSPSQVVLTLDAPEEDVTASNMLRMLDYSTGKVLKEVKLASVPSRLALSPSTESAAVAAVEGTYIFDTTTLAIKATLPSGSASCVAFSPDSRWIVTCGNEGDCSTRLFASETLAQVASNTVHTDLVNGVAFSPSSDKCASASYDGYAIIWSVPSLAALHKLRHTGEANCALFLTSKVLATGGDDTVIRVWDVSSGSSLKVIADHRGWVHSLSLSPDGKTFASGGLDECIKIFSVETYECIMSVKCAGMVADVKYVDDETVLSGVYMGDLVAIDLYTRRMKTKYAFQIDPCGVVVYCLC